MSTKRVSTSSISSSQLCIQPGLVPPPIFESINRPSFSQRKEQLEKLRFDSRGRRKRRVEEKGIPSNLSLSPCAWQPIKRNIINFISRATRKGSEPTPPRFQPLFFSEFARSLANFTLLERGEELEIGWMRFLYSGHSRFHANSRKAPLSKHTLLPEQDTSSQPRRIDTPSPILLQFLVFIFDLPGITLRCRKRSIIRSDDDSWTGQLFGVCKGIGLVWHESRGKRSSYAFGI